MFAAMYSVIQESCSYEYGNKLSILHCSSVVLIYPFPPSQPLCPYMEGSHRAQVIEWWETGFSEALVEAFFFSNVFAWNIVLPQWLSSGKVKECLKWCCFTLRLTLKDGFVFSSDLDKFWRGFLMILNLFLLSRQKL